VIGPELFAQGEGEVEIPGGFLDQARKNIQLGFTLHKERKREYARLEVAQGKSPEGGGEKKKAADRVD